MNPEGLNYDADRAIKGNIREFLLYNPDLMTLQLNMARYFPH